MAVRFSERMVSEMVQTFWAASQRGEFVSDAAAEAGTYRKKGTRWLAAAGGVSPAPRPGPERSLSDVRRARRDRARTRWRGVDARDRCAAGTVPLNDQPRAAAQRQPRGIPRVLLPGQDRACAGLRACRASQAVQARDEPGAAPPGPGGSAQALLAGADRRAAARTVPRLAGDAGVCRNDLPVAVCAVPRRAAPRPHPLPAHRPGATASLPPARAAQEHPGHDQHHPAARTGRRPRGPRGTGKAT